MFKDIRNEYAVRTAPLNDPAEVEILLNTMSMAGWELYTLHEAETQSGKPCYNCIFSREMEVQIENAEDIGDLKSPLEKMFETSEEPYNQCVQIQRKMKEKKEKIKKIKEKLDSINIESEHRNLNTQIADELKELQNMKAELAEAINPDRMYDTIETNKITILLSDELVGLADKENENKLLSEVVKLRQKLTDNLGYVLPYVKFDNSEKLNANEFEILIRDIPAYRGMAFANANVFRKEEIAKKPKNTVQCFDVLNNTEVYWIDENKTKDYWKKGKSAVEYIVDALEYITVKYAEDILDYSDMNNYLDLVIKQNQYLVDGLIPETISLGEIRYILAQLISEYVSVRDIVYIFEKIGDFVGGDEDADIIEEIRLALSRQISQNLSDDDNVITCLLLGEKSSEVFLNAIENEGAMVHATKVENIIKKIMNVVYSTEIPIEKLPIIVPLELRAIISGVLKGFIPKLRVISREEIFKDYKIEVVASC